MFKSLAVSKQALEYENQIIDEIYRPFVQHPMKLSLIARFPLGRVKTCFNIFSRVDTVADFAPFSFILVIIKSILCEKGVFLHFYLFGFVIGCSILFHIFFSACFLLFVFIYCLYSLEFYLLLLPLNFFFQ